MPAKYVGMDRFKARKEVVKDIDAEGLLIAVEDKKVMQPFGDRSGVVIEPMLTDQWFVAADKLAEEAMAKVDDSSTRFVPENWKKTYDHWMKDIQPWCISRQLWWGHQIPAFYFPKIEMGDAKLILIDDGDYTILVDADEGFVRTEQHFSYKDQMENYEANVHVNVLVADSKEQALSKNAELPEVLKRNGDEITIYGWRDPDVLDTWFSSGLWPFSTLGWPDNTEELARFYPTSTLVTAFDIIFFWVARMMMQGLHFMDEVPFKDVYIHALVLDEAGKKMSKSVGNTLDPLDLIDGVDIETLVAKRTRGLKNPEKAPKIEKATRKQYPDGFEPYGADALRFTLASMAGQGRNIRLSVDRIAGYRNFGTKLWSASMFGQMNDCNTVEDFDPSAVTMTLNQWIISELTLTVAEVSRCIESYRFNDAADAIYKFTWDTFCNYYLEMSKPTLSGDNQAEASETRAAFAWVRDQIVKLLHPFMPFITEDIWLKTSDRNQALIISDWPEFSDMLINEAATKDMNWLIELITNIRSVRAEMNIPPSKKAPLLMLADSLDPRLETYAEVLSPMARVESVEIASEAPKGALQTVVDGVTFAIPLDGLIDTGAEKARLSKEIEKAQSEIDKIDKKLSNEAFVSKAPEKVVTLQKERRAGYVDELDKLNEAIAALG